ncbi:MAG: ABC transporter permease [Bryobacterales bacterium]|nr:ABC transporter permease [Bryobacterales bacterium]
MGFADAIRLDVRYAIRILSKDRLFSIVAISTLALGIGVNTAVFSIVYGVLLRPLPYPEPSQLVRVCRDVSLDDISAAEYKFWKMTGRSFQSSAAHGAAVDQVLERGSQQEWIKLLPVTPGFFHTLGVTPLVGTELSEDPRAEPGVVLSYGLYLKVFAEDPTVIGRTVTIGSGSYRVMGVAPKDFWFPEPAEAFILLRQTEGRERGANTRMIARLKPNVTIHQAQAEMPALSASFRRSGLAESPDQPGLQLAGYHEWLAGDVRTSLLLLFGAVGLLLLIACSNLGGLLLARVTARRKEFALRLALGGTWWRLFRQYLVENIVLCMTGSLLGILGAWWFLEGVLTAVPFDFPDTGRIGLDITVLLFNLAVGLAIACVFSAWLLPRSSDHSSQALTAGSRAIGSSVRQRSRNVLVACETGLSLMLLVAAGLVIQSLYWLSQERLGFSSKNVLTFRTPPPQGWYKSGVARQAFEDAMLDRLKSLPGVTGVAAVNVLPLQEQNNFPAERASRPDLNIGGTEIRFVTPEYFNVLRIELKRGRAFNAGDGKSALPVAIVNETLARRWWPSEAPLGDRIVVGRFRGEDLGGINEPPREVVGIVADTKAVYLKEPPRPTIYLPAAQVAWMNGGMYWAVQTPQADAAASQIRSIVREIEPRQRVERLQTLDKIVASTSAGPRLHAWLFGFFAALALILTALGVYGLVSYSVAQRTAEIGTRMALGATNSDVMRLILSQGLFAMTIGIVLGLAGAFLLSRSITALLFGVRSTDPLSFAGGAALLLTAGLMASYLPARRAIKIDPSSALRAD